MPTPFYGFVGFVSWPLMRWLYRIDVHGFENLPTEGGLVLSANHTSNFDPWPLGFPLWPKRQLYFMAKSELFNPLLGPPLRAGGAFAVRRGEQDIEAIETAIELCREGKIVAMFPEGTRKVEGIGQEVLSPSAHRRGSHRAGGGRAARAGCHRGHRSHVSRLPQLKVAYGRPVETADLPV